MEPHVWYHIRKNILIVDVLNWAFSNYEGKILPSGDYEYNDLIYMGKL